MFQNCNSLKIIPYNEKWPVNWPLEKETEDKNDYYFEFENLDEDKNLKAFPLLNNGISSEKIDIELDKKRLNKLVQMMYQMH